MALNVESLRTGGPGAPARPLVVSRGRTRRRLWLDRVAGRLVVVGGIVIIASILAILFVIVAEVYPLFVPPRVESLPAATMQASPAAPGATGVDEYREIVYAITEDGMLRFTPLRVSGTYPPVPVAGLGRARVTAAAAVGGGHHVLGTSDGRAIPVDVIFAVEFEQATRVLEPRHTFGAPLALDPERRRPIVRVAATSPQAGPVVAGQMGPRDIALLTVEEKRALIGGSRREESVRILRIGGEGEISALRMDARGDDLFVGTSLGQVLRYDLRDRTAPRLAEATRVGDASVTVLGFLNGDRTLVVGDAAGGVSTWQVLAPPTGGAPRLTRIHDFARHGAAVVAVSPSRRDKGFVTADAAGRVHLSYGTTGETLLVFGDGRAAARDVVFAPRADGVLAIDARGGVAHWQVVNPHPEVTLRTLFGKVWYEGYPEPAYVWQSTGGTDDFEAKFSLTPLVYGTLKGTFYALLFAVPLALLAALYASEFMHPTVKAVVKPVVEIMAALPSVVLGFLAGLWLAPMVERVVPGLFLLPLVVTVAILLALLGWHALPGRARRWFRPGMEVFLLVPIVLAAAWVAFALGGLVEARLLGGDYRGWLLSAVGLTYDQRNSLVVGLAMGFAVIPIIFTIAEDSLANVPHHLRAGSLALGATRWQTAVRIVLPTASPGIFSAVMIGFGRAVGETMIVLMATGNTPVMDWNIFSGFRALSANIAVELPEAPEGGTLFRVLFLAALLLFCLTFALNTIAELVRLRLRQRYRYL
ncbi:MAG TPA: ABC transporter permease subunit [Candidatus Tectomicrobia bacterium]|nr:ABC transporter permease subunit [Candidatus Tectomicrobia bacterium]